MTFPPERLRHWGQFVYDSPLYSHLVELVADSPELLAVLGAIENRPQPNVFFAAVHYLLLGDPHHDLARFYDSIVQDPRPPNEAGPPFTAFVLTHRERILELGETRLTQTNEVRRCAILLPAIWAAQVRSFHLVDVGTSAGLNLALDRYGYNWGGVTWNESSRLVLKTESRGQDPVPTPIEIRSRTGLDLNPVDLASAEARRWLEALIWPGHESRRERLRVAIEVASDADMDLIAGDAVETLARVHGALPVGEPVVLMHSYVLNQFTEADRTALSEVIATMRVDRPVVRVGVEHQDPSQVWSDVLVDVAGSPEVVGKAHHHGEWIELYVRP